MSHGTVGCIFKGNKTMELSDARANNIEQPMPIFSFDIATAGTAREYVFRVTVPRAHYPRNEWFRSYPPCLKRKRSV